MAPHPPVLIRTVFVWAAACAGMPPPAAADAFPDKWTIREGGRMKTCEVALDEAGTSAPGRPRQVEKIPPRRSADDVRKMLAGKPADLILYESGEPRDAAHRRWLTRKVLVRLAPGTSAAEVARNAGAAGMSLPPHTPDRVVFFAPAEPGGALLLAQRLENRPGVLEVQPLLARQHVRRFIPNDPFFSDHAANAGYQWHLRNTGSRGGTAGIDANVAGAWDMWRGRNVLIGIVDDGLWMAHPDLQQNVAAGESYDFNEDDPDPSPGPDDRHGTACAGVAAARGNNGIGCSGAAPEAKLAGLRLISGASSDDQDAEAFLFREQTIAVKSNSWGPDDDGATLSGPEPLAAAALEHSATFGRGGKGTIFIWASGNGANSSDNSNFDGWANSVHATAVSAVSDNGVAAWYSEPGANILTCAPSDHFSSDQSITTTDLPGADGYNPGASFADYPDQAYTNDFGGTSAAAPLAAGVVALMLEANPALTVRDVQEILVRTAVKNDSGNPGWKTNGAGFHFSHQYGAGLLNATAATAMAAAWTNLPPEELRSFFQSSLGLAIPDNNTAGISRTFVVTAADDLRVEHVTVAVNISHQTRGQLTVDLISPAGTVSHLATRRSSDFGDNLVWTMSTPHCWGESAVGTWTVKVADNLAGTTGTLNAVTLTLRGSVPAPAVAPDIAANSTATGHQGSPLYYRIVARNGPVSFSAVTLPSGLVLDTVRGLITGTPAAAGEFDVTVGAANSIGSDSGNLHLSILDGPGVPLAAALDAPGQTWSTTDSRPWTAVATPAHDAVDAARSAALGDLAASSFQTTVTGPLILNFWWKVSSEPDYDFLRLLVDGVETAKIAGEVDWTQVTAGIPAGSHTVQWEYRKDNSTAEGDDAAWVDEVVFSPAGTAAPVFVRMPQAIAAAEGSRSGFIAEAIGAAPLSYQWKKGSSILPVPDSPVLILPVVAAGNAGNYTVTVSNGAGSATSAAASLTVTSASASAAFAAAVGSSGLSWGSAPNAWTVQTTTVFSPASALRSASIGNAAESWLYSFVEGPATLSFQWKTDSEWNYDFAQFRVDGVPQAALSGLPYWQPGGISVPAGPHVLSWGYVKNVSDSDGADAAFLDSVVLVPLRYESFAHTIFTAAELHAGAITGPADDADADGADNFSEYAFGTAPRTPNRPAAPAFGLTSVSGDSYRTLTWVRRTDFAVRGLTYMLLSSTDGVAWVPATVVPVSTTSDGSFDTVTVRLPNPVSTTAPRLFFKVSVSE